MFGRELANLDQWPIFIARAPWPEHLQKHALEQVVELLQVLFALGDQPFDLAEQMGNADLIVKGWERNF
ncbi:hypothetical protein AO715_11635 [Xanthomonas sp. Mitacek01]|nr:hypothetical protein AO715_11635 [Xanthomonas sp. Mitacek01]